MKILVFLLAISSLGFSLPAYSVDFCAIRAAKRYIMARTTSAQDKQRHCVVSCVGTLYCSPQIIRAGGVYKEVQDILDGDSSTNPEVSDHIANESGIRVGVAGRPVYGLRAFSSKASYCQWSCAKIWP